MLKIKKILQYTEGIKAQDVVDLFSHYIRCGKNRAAIYRRAIRYSARQCSNVFPEANSLIPVDEYADKSFTPISKSVVVRIKRVWKIELLS